jgi:Lanthionine synthetase C-like protein
VPGRGDPIAWALRLGERLAADAVRVDGNAAWIGATPVDNEHGNLSVVDIDLYAGTTGIALFLAALARIAGDARFRDLAIEAIGPAQRIRTAVDGGARAARRLGIGAASGIGSIVYGLVSIAALLDEPSLAVEAEALAELIDDERIGADLAVDVVDGAAGAILSLLALYRARGSEAALVRAVPVERKRGRPSDYCAEIAMTICDRLAEGKSLRAICTDAGMPDKATVLRWIGRHKGFRDQYAWAREAQADDLSEECLEIADDTRSVRRRAARKKKRGRRDGDGNLGLEM